MLSRNFSQVRKLRSAGNFASALPLLHSSAIESDEDAFEAMICLFVSGNFEAVLAQAGKHEWRSEWSRNASRALVGLITQKDTREALSLARSAVSAPDVAMPAAKVRVPRRMPAVSHSSGVGVALSTTSSMNMVVPYEIMRSPRRLTLTLNASAHASIVPATTGVPAGMSVARAAALVTSPMASPAAFATGAPFAGASPWSMTRLTSLRFTWPRISSMHTTSCPR